MSAETAIRTVIADDHPVVRAGLATLLAGSGIEVVGEASNGDEAVEQTRAQRPDVLLLDVVMPETDGLTALERLHEGRNGTQVIMLSSHDNPTYVARSVALGARDYLLKDCSREDLIEAIKRASKGEAAPAGSLVHRMASVMRSRQETLDEGVSLTRRETQVLRHLALGLSNREIATSLTISVETVKEHVQGVLRKLELSSRTQAALWAVRKGLL